MALRFVPLSTFGLDAAATVMARAFEDYFVKLACTSAWLLHAARYDSVDLAASRVIVRDEAAIGAALIARRGWSSRLAGMTLVPEARGQGIGRATMAHLLEAARQREERGMELEVIAGNTAAERLYASCGFQRVRRLLSFVRNAELRPMEDARHASDLEVVDPRQLAAVIARHGLEDLPWQLAAETIAHMAPPGVAYRLNGSWIAVANLATPEPVIRALITETDQRRQGRALALLHAVLARHPGKTWRVSALWPEEIAPVLLAAGFVRDTLSQWHLRRALP